MQFTIGIENFSFRIRTFLVWRFHLEYNYQEMSYLNFSLLSFVLGYTHTPKVLSSCQTKKCGTCSHHFNIDIKPCQIKILRVFQLVSGCFGIVIKIVNLDIFYETFN